MRNRFGFVACLAILMASGCVYHGGYPYGYTNGNYGAGPSVLPPGQWGYPTTPSTSPYYQPGVTPYTVPGGTVPGGNPTPIDGSNPPNSAPLGNNPPQTYDNGGGNAPTFDPTNPGGVPVPNDDDTNGRSPGAQRPLLTPTSGASTKLRSSSDDLSTPFEQDETNRTRQNPESESVADTEVPYEAPLVRQISNTQEIDEQPASQLTRTTDDAKRPYGRDAQFQWIKGVLDYDDTNKTWVIMYDDNPSPADRLGGELTLAEHPLLERVRPNDAVRIEGSFDQFEKDGNGKPVYLITRLKKQ